MAKPEFEVLGEDANGDDWIVAVEDEATADAFAQKFLEEGLTNVRLEKLDLSYWNRDPYATPSPPIAA